MALVMIRPYRHPRHVLGSEDGPSAAPSDRREERANRERLGTKDCAEAKAKAGPSWRASRPLSPRPAMVAAD
jgi:hypothetical protein